MCIKIAVSRLKLQWKSLGWIRFLPLGILYLLLPALGFLAVRRFGRGVSLYQDLLQYAQYFIPLLSCLWPGLFLHSCMEGRGAEALRRFSRCHSSGMSLFGLLYMMALLPLFAGFAVLVPRMALEYFRLIAECFIFEAVLYFSMAVTRSLALSFIPLTGYYLWNLFFVSETPSFLQILNAEPVSVLLLRRQLLPALLVGILLLGAGVVLQHRSERIC